MIAVDTKEIKTLLIKKVINGAVAKPSRKFCSVHEPLKENKLRSKISAEGRNAAFQDQRSGTAVKPVMKIKKK
jgi:hypothetical protein